MRINCGECGGDGVAEYIDYWARPCDACHGDGEINVPFLWGVYFRIVVWRAARRKAA